MNWYILGGFVLANLGSVLGEMDVCQVAERFTCIFGGVVTEVNCHPLCSWCSSLGLSRKCQTKNHACHLLDRRTESAYTTRSDCEGEGLVWCGGRTQACVHPEPVRELCFQNFNVDPCPTTHTNEVSCNTDSAGCFWCVEGRLERLSPNRCWKLPVDCSTDSCCEEAPCRRNFDAAECAARGCNYCVQNGNEQCNFGPPVPLHICPHGVMLRYDDATTCCQSHTFVCGRNPLNENQPLPPAIGRKKRVIGGMPTGSVETWPWLGVVYVSISSTVSYCPGTLIGDKWLITAADCVRDMDAADSLVHLDVYDRNEAPGIEANIQEFHIYSNFGVAELTAPVTPYSHCVHPLCMPNGEIAEEDRKCVVAGWGLTVAGDSSSWTTIPRDATVRVMDWGLCEQAWGEELVGELDPADHFCAGIPEGGKDFCTKDLGAPLMCQRCENCGWFLAGIATPYTSCGNAQEPGVYYRVDGDVQAWIDGQFMGLPLDPNTYTSCPP